MDDVVEAMDNDRDDCACNESCWEFDASLLKESLDSAPDHDCNTYCPNHTKIGPTTPVLLFKNSKLVIILKRDKGDRE